MLGQVTAATDSGAPPLPRAQFPLADRAAYLDHGVAGPLPLVAVEAATRELARGAEGSPARADRDEVVARARAAAAGLLGVGTDDVALVRNTTDAMATVASGIDWGPGDRVLVAAGDHPSTTLPWRAWGDRGVEVEEVAPRGARLPAEAFAPALERGGGAVRVVAVSWVRAHDGWRTDLAALAHLAHAHGALLCVDAIQGVGVVPAEVGRWGVDATACGAQKWMLGPPGLGVLHVAPALRERLHVRRAGSMSLATSLVAGSPPDLWPDARRYEGGARDPVAAAALVASLDLLAAAGPGRVWRWVDRLCTRLAEGARDRGLEVLSDRTDGPGAPEGRSALVTVAVPGVEALDVVARLAEDGVVAAARGGGVRFAPHGWNDDGDVDRALAALAAL